MVCGCKPERHRCTGNTQVCQVLTEQDGSASELLGSEENQLDFLSTAVSSNRGQTGNECASVRVRMSVCVLAMCT